MGSINLRFTYLLTFTYFYLLPAAVSEMPLEVAPNTLAQRLVKHISVVV